MGNPQDITGKRSGHLVAMWPCGRTLPEDGIGTIVWWMCACDCGNYAPKRTGDLRKNLKYCSKACPLKKASHRAWAAGHFPVLPPKCTRCGETDAAKFQRNRHRRNGYQQWCRPCSEAYREQKRGRPQGKERRISLAKTEQERWNLILHYEGCGEYDGRLQGEGTVSSAWDEVMLGRGAEGMVEIMANAGCYGGEGKDWYQETRAKYERQEWSLRTVTG